MLGFFLLWKGHCIMGVRANTAAAERMIREGKSPCCAFPCLHRGVCVNMFKTFYCDCSGTGFSGVTCEKPTFSRFIELRFTSREALYGVPSKCSVLCRMMPIFPQIHLALSKFIVMMYEKLLPNPHLYNVLYDHPSLDVYYNRSIYGRALQVVPPGCPTPMGIHGPSKFPSVDEVYERLLKRRNFIPCPKGTNVFFITYSQFFRHLMHMADYHRGFGFSYQGLDASNIYGPYKRWYNPLRTFRCGKLRTVVIEEEDVPPSVIGSLEYQQSNSLQDVNYRGSTPRKLTQELRSPSAPLFVMSTLFVREHNRICDLLRDDHPEWDDERLYQTAKLVVTGIIMQIAFNEYLMQLNQHIWPFLYNPESYMYSAVQYKIQILQDISHIYDWHTQTPDVLQVEDELYNFQDLLYQNNSIVFRHGFNRFLAAMFVNIAGKVTARNDAEMLEHVKKSLLEEGRLLRLQSFNSYRRSLGILPHKSFMSLTKDEELAKELEELYGDIEAVEFYVGLLVEKDSYSIMPNTLRLIINSWTLKWILANPLGTPLWWKPVTVGGQKFFDIIRFTTLRQLVCRNLRGRGCSKMHVSFSVPDSILEAAMQS